MQSLPRLGGGVSRSSPFKSNTTKSSPPRRGCFPKEVQDFYVLMVFPASAGVFLKKNA